MIGSCESAVGIGKNNMPMGEPARDDAASVDEVQENIDQAVEDVTNLEFATLEALEEAFRR